MSNADGGGGAQDSVIDAFRRLKNNGLVAAEMDESILQKTVIASHAYRRCPVKGCNVGQPRIGQHLSRVHADLSDTERKAFIAIAHWRAQSAAEFCMDLSSWPMPTTDTFTIQKLVIDQLVANSVPYLCSDQFQLAYDRMVQSNSDGRQDTLTEVRNIVEFGFAPRGTDNFCENLQGFFCDREKTDALNAVGYYCGVKVCDHSLLSEYSEFIKNQLKAPKTGNGSTGRGKQAYIGCMQRFIYQLKRRIGSYGTPLTLEECCLIPHHVQHFFEWLRALNISTSMRDTFAKSFRSFSKFVKQELTRQGKEITATDWLSFDTLKELANAELDLNEKERRAHESLAKPYQGQPYALLVATCHLERITKKTDSILNRFFARSEITKADYDYLLGSTMHSILIKNAGRLEAFWKVCNGNLVEIAGIETELGLLQVIRYPNDKSGALSWRNVMHGAFVVNSRMVQCLEGLKQMRDKLLAESGVATYDNDGDVLLLDYNMKPLTCDSVRTILQRFWTTAGLSEVQCGCDQVRRAAAQLGYDDYCTQFLDKEMASEQVARLMGHGRQIQSSVYVPEKRLKYVCGYLELHNLVQTQADEEEVKKLIAAVLGVNQENAETDGEREQPGGGDERQGEEQQADERRQGDEQEQGDENPGEEDERRNEPEQHDNEHEGLQIPTTLSNDLKDLNLEHDTNILNGSLPLESPAPALSGSSLEPDPKLRISTKRKNRESRTSPRKRVDIELDDVHIENGLFEPLDDVATNSASGSHISVEDLESEWLKIEAQLEHHNSLPAERMFKSTDPHFWALMYKHRYKSPVQGWPVAVRKAPGLQGGKGLFMKCDAKPGDVLCDYRGRTALLHVHEQKMRTLSPADLHLYEMYNFDFQATLEDKTVVDLSISAHQMRYGESVVLGRFANNSKLHHNCEARVALRRTGDVYDVIVYFKAIGHIAAGTQLLWNYGPKFNEQKWPFICICARCHSANDDYDEQSTVAITYPPDDEESYSQSLVIAPLMMRPQNDEARRTILAVNSELCKDASYCTRTLLGWKLAFNRSRSQLGHQDMEITAAGDGIDYMAKAMLLSSETEGLKSVIIICEENVASSVITIGEGPLGAIVVASGNGFVPADLDTTNRLSKPLLGLIRESTKLVAFTNEELSRVLQSGTPILAVL